MWWTLFNYNKRTQNIIRFLSTTSKLPNSIGKKTDNAKPETNLLLAHIKKESADASLSLELKKSNRIWKISVQDNVMTRIWGVTGGLMQTRIRTYNIGKGQRSPNQQARLEAISDAQKKLASGYGFVNHEDSHIVGLVDLQDRVPLPMLAYPKLESVRTDASEAYVQPKLDGLRCLANIRTGTLWSRSRKPIESLPHISKAVRSRANVDFDWIDGELYHHGSSIQTINSIIRNGSSAEADRTKISFFAFDAIAESPFERRWESVKKWHSCLRRKSIVQLTETTKIPTDQISDAHEQYRQKGYEGIMVRALDDTPYREGKRSRSLQKLKSFQREEFKCLDILPQKNTKEEIAGSFVLETSDGRQFHAAPKCTREEKVEMWKERAKYMDGKFIAMVQYAELSKDGIPIFPVLVGFRHEDDL